MFNSTWDHYIMGWVGGKIIRANSSGRLQQNRVPDTTVSTMAHMNSQRIQLQAQDLYKYQVSPNPYLCGGAVHEIPPLTEELLTADGFWGKESLPECSLWGA